MLTLLVSGVLIYVKCISAISLPVNSGIQTCFQLTGLKLILKLNVALMWFSRERRELKYFGLEMYWFAEGIGLITHCKSVLHEPSMTSMALFTWHDKTDCVANEHV